jgi:hypothetical protein
MISTGLCILSRARPKNDNPSSSDIDSNVIAVRSASSRKGRTGGGSFERSSVESGSDVEVLIAVDRTSEVIEDQEIVKS